MSQEQYEFSDSQNELIRDLSQKMKFVSSFLKVVGGINAIGGALAIVQHQPNGASAIINGVVYVLIGVWTSQAASSFLKIVDTQGNDIENLMLALGELRKLYQFQYWVLIICIIFVILAFVAGIIIAASSAGR
jgi:hypothetical protein